MLEQICRRRWSRDFGALVGLVLGACADAAPASLGSFELSAAATRGAACAAGELRIEGRAGLAPLVFSGAELCAGLVRRHELPPGSYTLSWRSAAFEPGESSPLSGPSVVSLLPGQVTRLRVKLESRGTDSGATGSSQLGAEPAEPAPACSYGERRSGAS